MRTTMFGIAALIMIANAPAKAANQEEERERFHAAFADCAAQLGIPLPEKGKKPEKLADGKKAELDSCLERQGVTLPPPHPEGDNHADHEAMRACVQASGVDVPPPPHPGEARVELTAEQKSVLDKCHAQVSDKN